MSKLIEKCILADKEIVTNVYTEYGFCKKAIQIETVNIIMDILKDEINKCKKVEEIDQIINNINCFNDETKETMQYLADMIWNRKI